MEENLCHHLIIRQSLPSRSVHRIGLVAGEAAPPPEARRRGIVRKRMIHLLNQARSEGLRYATLQAAVMGGLYREPGFEAPEALRNDSRKPTVAPSAPLTPIQCDPLCGIEKTQHKGSLFGPSALS